MGTVWLQLPSRPSVGVRHPPGGNRLLDQLHTRAIMLAVRWTDFAVAAQRGDAEECKAVYEKIRAITIDVANLLKATEKSDG